MVSEVTDPDFGALTWDAEFNGWEGSTASSSGDRIELYIFARPELTTDRIVTEQARAAFQRLRNLDIQCRDFAAAELLEILNSEWNDGPSISATEFIRRLQPEAIEIHESGYSEVHFGDDGMFLGHSVGVRLRSDGSFQEAVLEG